MAKEPGNNVYFCEDNWLIKETPCMEIIDEVLVALRRLIRATDLHSRHLNKTVGLTAPQLLLLQTVRREVEVPIGDIARSMSLSQATVTTIVDRLEGRALLKRQRSQQDKRKVYVSLTEEGRRILDNAPTALHTRLIDKFQFLEDWEQAMILSSLQRLATLVDAEGIDASPLLDIGELDRGGGPSVDTVASGPEISAPASVKTVRAKRKSNPGVT